MITTTDLDLDAAVIRAGAIVLTHEGGEKGRHYGGGLISLQRGLGPINRRCTLAHELGHHVLGHDPQATGWLHARQERQADEWAANLLITPETYAQAEHLHGPVESAIAAELGVTKQTLATWRNHYQRKAA